MAVDHDQIFKTLRKFLGSENPLAFALMAKMKYNQSQRVKLKADFLRWILGVPINPAKQSILLEFIETYMTLTRTEESKFSSLVSREPEYLEVEKMITTFEKRGMEKGQIEGKRESLLLLLERRFQELDDSVKKKIQRIRSAKRLNSLMLEVLEAESIGDLNL